MLAAWGFSQGALDTETIRYLLAEIEALKARVAGLQEERAAAVASTTDSHPAEVPPSGGEREAPETTAPFPPAEWTAEAEADSGGGIGADPSLHLRGFADTAFRASGAGGESSSFALGQLDFFITSQISDRLGVLAETVLEASGDNEVAFEPERVLLQYSHNRHLRFDIGRYHSAIGYYNTAFHHGQYFQTATERPFIFRFEDENGLLPVHNVGLRVSGELPAAKLGLNYLLEVGNGRSCRSAGVEPVQAAVDENNGKSINAGLWLAPHGWQGFQAAVSIYHDALARDSLPGLRQRIYAVYVVLNRGPVEWLGEGIVTRHSVADSASTKTAVRSFYTQFSYGMRGWRPFGRYERLSPDGADPVARLLLDGPGRRNIFTGGVRRDLGESAAIKLQMEHASRSGFSSTGAATQLTFTF